jgi:hypothetical protein
MNWPWTGKSGLGKAAAILATTLLISTGLCGVNFIGARNVTQGASIWLLLSVIELAAMALSTVGLFVVLIVWICKAVRRSFFTSNGD